MKKRKRENEIIKKCEKNINNLQFQLRQEEQLCKINQNYCYLSDASLKRAYYELF